MVTDCHHRDGDALRLRRSYGAALRTLYSAGKVDRGPASSAGSRRKTSQPKSSVSARTTSEDTAAIGSPTAGPEYTRPTPIVRTIVPTIQIQTCTKAKRLRSTAGCK